MATRLGPDVQRASLDGIPVFWADAPPPHEAELMFRVGRADETLTTSGITHLVEHMAMPLERPRFECNAWVGDLMTSFWAKGTLEEIVGFLAERTAQLGALPVERLEVEKQILTAEEAANVVDPITGLVGARFGSKGFGLIANEQLGLRTVGENELLLWARTYFNARNAALSVKGPFSPFPLELPDGERMTPPEPSQLDVRFPAWLGGWPDGVHLTFLSPRKPETMAACGVFDERANRQLRFETGLVYGVEGRSTVLGGDAIHVALWAQCVHEHFEPVRDGMLGILDALATDGPTDEELAREVDSYRRGATDPANVSGALSSHAGDELLGLPFEAVDAWGKRLEAVTPDSAARELGAALETALLALSGELECSDARFTALPEYAVTERVVGEEFKPRGLVIGLPRRERLVVTPEGVTFALADGRFPTVRFDSCAAVLAWPDGSRGLWGEDGTYMEVLPRLWKNGERASRKIDEHRPADRVVQMAADDPLRTEPQAGR